MTIAAKALRPSSWRRPSGCSGETGGDVYEHDRRRGNGLWRLDQIAETLGLGDLRLSVLRIIGVDIVLAGDNAVVIALACRTLPPRQRMAGIVLGTAAAVAMRIVFTLAVSSLLGVPLLGARRRAHPVLDRH